MSIRVAIQFERHRRALTVALWLLLSLLPATPLSADDRQVLIRAIPRMRLDAAAPAGTPQPIIQATRTISAGVDELVPDQVMTLDVPPPAGPGVSQDGAVWLGSMTAIDAQPPRVLDGRDIACRAARNWIPSDLLRMRACTVLRLHGDEKDEDKRCAAFALAQFLRIQACHQEDIGAASALRAYYTRIALAEKQALTLATLRMINEEDAKHEALRAQGFSAAVDVNR